MCCMKVIKEGNLAKTDPLYMFECSKCGCVFQANKSECKCERDGYFYACPTCGYECENRKQPYFEEMPVECLGLSVRPQSILKRSGYATVGDILRASKEDVYKCRNMGERSYSEILDKLTEFGITLREDESNERLDKR